MRYTSSKRFVFSVIGAVVVILATMIIFQPLQQASLIPAKQEQDNSKKREVAFKYEFPPDIKFLTIKNLNKPDWLRELEIKIKNDSTKPIYHLQMWVDLPEIANGSLGFLIEFGRSELSDFKEQIKPEDDSIGPGEIYILKIPKFQIANYEKMLDRMKERSQIVPEINKILIALYRVNFGDGTGYFIGKPFPYYPSEKKISKKDTGKLQI